MNKCLVYSLPLRAKKCRGYFYLNLKYNEGIVFLGNRLK